MGFMVNDIDFKGKKIKGRNSHLVEETDRQKKIKIKQKKNLQRIFKIKNFTAQVKGVILFL